MKNRIKLLVAIFLIGQSCVQHKMGMDENNNISNRTRGISNRISPVEQSQPLYLDPKADITFKRIFKSDPKVTANFLNSVLELDNDDAIEVESFEDNENIASGRDPKITYFDIIVKDKRGEYYIIEMQLAYEEFFKKRVQYYAANKYSGQLRKKGAYNQLKKVVCLTVTGHKLFKDDLEEFGKLVHKKEYRREHLILDKETYKNDLEDLSWVFIEIPKFKKSIDDLSDLGDHWCSFLRGDVKTEEDSKKVSGGIPEISQAIEQLKSCNYTQNQLDEYRRDIIYIANKNVTDKQKQEVWEKKGVEKVARYMIADNEPIEKIIRYTGLPKKEIVSLKRAIEEDFPMSISNKRQRNHG